MHSDRQTQSSTRCFIVDHNERAITIKKRSKYGWDPSMDGDIPIVVQIADKASAKEGLKTGLSKDDLLSDQDNPRRFPDLSTAAPTTPISYQ